jgi:hypothetical protein
MLSFDLTCPKGVEGTFRLYIIDGDNFYGGRKETTKVAGREIGTYVNFQKGLWLDVPISSADTSQGRIPVRAVNLTRDNAVVSLIRFVER